MNEALDRAIDDAAQHIRSSRQTASIPESLAKLGITAADKSDFCTMWKKFIKAALEILKGFLPAWAAALVDILIRIGDKACPK